MNAAVTTTGSVPLRSYIDRQARGLGFSIQGRLRRCEEYETATLEKCFMDENGNIYRLRHGILTIVGADGSVY